jgi:Na+-translocating ferredoxin:NAD+ oxidoreductase RnfD subunit
MAKDMRIAALSRFAIAITVFNILGHFVLGFEQSWLQPLVSLATAYTLELVLELVSSKVEKRSPRYKGGFKNLMHFLLSAHITGLAVAMLLYANEALWPVMFGTSVAIASKTIFKVMVNGRLRHFLNPSNTGIATTLLLFPWVGIAPPYHFTENLVGVGDWVLPAIIVMSGTFLNAKFTARVPLILAWVGGFALQAAIRNVIFAAPWAATFLPMTGVAFMLFTFYMVSDPGTTPFSKRGQVIFGLSAATVYGLLIVFHIVFGLFFL